MAMTLPIVIPSPPPATASAGSPSSDGSSSGPRTPVSPSHQSLSTGTSETTATNPSTGGITGTNGKRKPSRRANTAERRATHNAVERARRETLNSRFLDLAKMLPNLSQIRRPSKSAIVNSSIAHIHASRRHRALASRELRMLKLEADHLRRELNEWRDRAGIPRVEEPVRNEGFSMILNQELEVIPVMTSGAGDDDEDGVGLYGDEGGSVEGGDEDIPMSGGAPIGVEEQRNMMMAAAVGGRPSPPAISVTTNFSYPTQQRPPFAHHPHSHPMIAASGSFDGYTEYPAANLPYSGLPNDKFATPQMQQYIDNISMTRRRSGPGRDRSNSMASMTSSGSASPPLYSHQATQPQFESGWGGIGMNHQTMQMNGGGGIGNGVTFAMM